MSATAAPRRTRSNRKNHPPSERRHVPNFFVTKWTKSKAALVTIATLLLATTTILPVMLLEQATSESPLKFKAPVSLHNLIEKSKRFETGLKEEGATLWKKAKDSLHVKKPREPISHHEEQHEFEDTERHNIRGGQVDKNEDGPKKRANLAERQVVMKNRNKLARGVSGLPMAQTPALIGARPGHVDCDVDVDDIVYWNDPQGLRDVSFESPFANLENHYLTFEPDAGGWNNIRMSMEIIFILAAATGRTLVLPPKSPMYLLGRGKENARTFGNFYPLMNPEFQKRVKIITMEEFFEIEGERLLNLSSEELKKLKPITEMCLHQPGDALNCENLYQHLRKAGLQPPLEAAKNCFIFDKERFDGKGISEDVNEKVTRFCGEKRTPVFYEKKLHEPDLIHWDAGHRDHRLLNHFYAFVLFTDPAIDNHFKRFVRDFLHYEDKLYCAAGKIIHALTEESETQGHGWSSVHVRRGDLQYKKVKISAEEWYENTKELWEEGEILFIATDERNKTFFDPIKEHHELRFLDDYWDMAKLGDLDSNFLGMIDTIVASHGRAFAGTWFSTFTGYINRLRGYLGHSITNSWYGWLPRKDAMQEFSFPGEGKYDNYVAKEWPIGWVAIDSDELIEHEGDLVMEKIDTEKLEQAESKLRPIKVGGH